ncbi:uncharacterized protein isoform X1 [Choristoneura fumiferana]|uniref:uncharacterized protein isoform X1 n=1 Tax=Choristoneura fumiferana TaxID=7141 RepID=UPI003D15B389
MNSVKPVLPQPGAPGVQSSPAKAAVASGPLAGGNLPALGGSLVGQNLTQPVVPPLAPPAQPLAHAAPSMAPVSANMAQMAQNMSHHGNLSHVTQNSVAPVLAASPAKVTPAAPLSLVQDKPATPVPSQPLALTRTPEKKDADSTVPPGPPNGTVDSPKPASNAPATLKPQNPEPSKDIDIAKISPSTPKPPEKPAPAPSTPQKAEPANPNQAADPTQPKVATANEAPEKSPAKPSEPKPAPTADVAPSQSDSKPVPESAKAGQCQEKVPTPQKQDPPATDSVKVDNAPKEEKKPEPEKVEKPVPKPVEEPPKQEPEPKKPEAPKKEEKPVEPVEKLEKPEEKVEEKKAEAKVPAKTEVKAAPKSTLKLATVTPQMRKRRHVSPTKSSDGHSAAKKAAEDPSTPDSRSKRNRTKVQLYQSPTPDIAMATKLSASAGRSTPPKQNDDKLIVFYKNEYLAVRNAEGGFYVCQTTQNVYRTTRKIKIRWLSQDKAADPSGETYKPDFYDVTDMECVLTTLSLTRAPGGGGAQLLRAAEQARATSILQRALKADQEHAAPAVTEEHPDGLDLSLYKDESQLEKKSRKRTSSKSSPRAKPEANNTAKEVATPVKKTRSTPKRSPKRKSKATPQKPQTKRKSPGTTPIVATASKVGIVQRIYRNTATAVSEKAKAKTPKRTPTKKETPPPTPTRKGGRRASGRDSKPSPLVPTPSTSTGKATRTPRKPPANK